MPNLWQQTDGGKQPPTQHTHTHTAQKCKHPPKNRPTYQARRITRCFAITAQAHSIKRLMDDGKMIRLRLLCFPKHSLQHHHHHHHNIETSPTPTLHIYNTHILRMPNKHGERTIV